MDKISDLSNKVLIDNGFYEKVPHAEGETFEGFELDENQNYIKKVALNLSDDELSKIVSLKKLEYFKSFDEKLSTIKSIMVFWLVLTIISLICSLYAVSRFF